MNTVAETTLKTPVHYETLVFNPPIAAPEAVAAVSENGDVPPWRIGLGVRYGIFVGDNKNSQGLGGIETVVSDPLSPTMNPLVTATPNVMIRKALTGTKDLPKNTLEGQFSYFDAVLNARMKSQPSIDFIGRGALAGVAMLNSNDFSSQKDKDEWRRTFTAHRLGVSYTYKFSGRIVDTTPDSNPKILDDTPSNNSPLPAKTWRTGYATLGVYFDVLNLTRMGDESESVPHIRLELGMAGKPKVNKIFNPTQSGGEAYAVLEVDMKPELLEKIQGLSQPVYGLRLSDDVVLDVTDLVTPMSDDFKAAIPQAKDGTEAINLADAGDAAMQKLESLLPANIADQAQAAMAYAPMAMTTAQYAPTVVRGARMLRGVGTFLSSGEGALLAATAGKALVYADLIGAGLEGLTSESALEYYATGQVSAETKIHDALGYSDLAMGARVFESWMEDDKTITYPRILDALQTARADDTQAVKAQSAAQVIESTPALRYLDALETYAKAHGLEGGAYGADAAQIAEALVQGADEAHRPAILADLAEQFGLTRENADLSQKGDWWVTATDVDRGNGQPLKSTRKPIDALAFWRSDSGQAIVEDKRAITVVGNIVPALGTHFTPEVIDKSKATAPRPTAEFRN